MNDTQGGDSEADYNETAKFKYSEKYEIATGKPNLSDYLAKVGAGDQDEYESNNINAKSIE